MVKLNMDMIARCTSGYSKKKREETTSNYIKRLTHLYLENRGINEVNEDLNLCQNLTVLYLYDNELSVVPVMNHNCNLTHLYLQNNNISKIEHLSALARLQKLYIGGNTITVLEGLKGLNQLQELHVENQRLPSGEQLLFDPRSLQAIAGSLQVLNVSGNNLTSIRELDQLPRLTQLMATDNRLSDMKEMSYLLSSLKFLWRLDLKGNPICQKSKFADRIIVMAASLGVLDGRNITQTTRQFLVNWQANREERKRTQDNLNRGDTCVSEFTETKELPPVKNSLSRQTSISGYVMPGLPRKQFDDILAKSNFPDPDKMRRTRSGILRANSAYGRTRKEIESQLLVEDRPRRPLSVQSIRLTHLSTRKHDVQL